MPRRGPAPRQASLCSMSSTFELLELHLHVGTDPGPTADKLVDEWVPAFAVTHPRRALIASPCKHSRPANIVSKAACDRSARRLWGGDRLGVPKWVIRWTTAAALDVGKAVATMHVASVTLCCSLTPAGPSTHRLAAGECTTARTPNRRGTGSDTPYSRRKVTVAARVPRIARWTPCLWWSSLPTSWCTDMGDDCEWRRAGGGKRTGLQSLGGWELGERAFLR